jgi:hypothetical protein
VRPVDAHVGEQRPLRTTHAAPGPNSSWQSVSWLQNRHKSVGTVTPAKSAQKAALPEVSVQRQRGLLELHWRP